MLRSGWVSWTSDEDVAIKPEAEERGWAGLLRCLLVTRRHGPALIPNRQFVMWVRGPVGVAGSRYPVWVLVARLRRGV